MKISYNWLHDFVEFHHSPEELGNILTALGHTVDALDCISAGWQGVIVAQVKSCEPITGSDHLTLCKVDAGAGELLPVVCGAPNVSTGQTVPLAVSGARLPGDFRVGERRVRGVLSQGMICSARELGLSDDHSGIMVLPAGLPLGYPLEQFVGKSDWIYDLDITFSRPDCLSHLGIAREISAKLNLPLSIPGQNDELHEQPVKPLTDFVSIDIVDPDRCPRYTARLVAGVQVSNSPLWIQERLRAVGVRPISNIVDVSNYLMLELGHPLHTFDYHLVADKKIIVRRARKGEKFTTLDNKDHELTTDDLLIADPVKGIALAGVMGGLNSEINENTRDVLIECAYFAPEGIQKTSRFHNIISESSRRFERGVDVQMTLFAVTRTASMIKELAGGEIAPVIADAYPKRWNPSQISLNPNHVNSLLSTRIDKTTMVGYLNNLGCKIEDKSDIQVVPPSWRSDLKIEADLIEEVGRMFGYDNIPASTTSHLPLCINTKQSRIRNLERDIRSGMVELGIRESVSWTLVPQQDSVRMPVEVRSIRLQNPISEDLATLRTSLLPTLLRAVSRNANNGIDNIRLFEWGRVYYPKHNEISEEYRLGIVLYGLDSPRNWCSTGNPLTAHHIKGIIQALIKRIALDNVKFIYYVIPEYLSTGGTIQVESDANLVSIGYFGLVKSELADRFGVDHPVWYIEFDGNKLIEYAGQTQNYKSLPRFPAALRDLAFVVEQNIEAGQLIEVIRESGGGFLESVDLFDVYTGKELDERKSLAFHLLFRSPDRTLSDTEVDTMIERLVAEVRDNTGAVLRS